MVTRYDRSHYNSVAINLGQWFINIVSIIVFSLLILRFFFELFGANPNASFVNWVYDSSFPLVRPFNNIFSSPTLDGGFVFDITTIMAMIVYGLLFYLIQYFIDGIETARESRQERVTR